MPYPGTGAYQWVKDNGYLATENYEEWVTAEGGHRCVLNLPGLGPAQLEAFCETAFRTFHFRPKYLFRKMVQLCTRPREWFRSVNAAGNYFKYLFTNKRDREQSFPSPPIALSEDWHATMKVPHGRMERMETTLKQLNKASVELDTPEAHDQLLDAEEGAQR